MIPERRAEDLARDTRRHGGSSEKRIGLLCRLPAGKPRTPSAVTSNASLEQNLLLHTQPARDQPLARGCCSLHPPCPAATRKRKGQKSPKTGTIQNLSTACGCTSCTVLMSGAFVAHTWRRPLLAPVKASARQWEKIQVSNRKQGAEVAGSPHTVGDADPERGYSNSRRLSAD